MAFAIRRSMLLVNSFRFSSSFLMLLSLLVLLVHCAYGTNLPNSRLVKRCVNCSYRGNSYYPNDYTATYYSNYNNYNTYPTYRSQLATSRANSYISGCQGNPCGANAVCREGNAGQPVCSCPPGYSGNPLTHCNRGECLDNIECRGDLECKNGRCVNPCLGACGASANCEPRNHVAVCSCPNGYAGDPFTACRRVSADEQCQPSPCGLNAKCEVLSGVPTCSCLPGYLGNPLSGCRHECDHDGDCSARDMCTNYKCVPACQQCGTGATCNSVANHRAVCECPKGYIGTAYSECRPECYGDSDCPANRPACFYGICKDTCEGACGVGADCQLRGLTPVCSCPRDMTGDPFVRCRPFTKEDLCEPNPCGTNALCIPGHDQTGRERPVCNCLPGHTGNPLSYCSRGQCLSNTECPDNKACINYQCVNPCLGKCATGATCEPRAHLAVCKCPPGFVGDALVSCRQSRTIAVAKYN